MHRLKVSGIAKKNIAADVSVAPPLKGNCLT